MLKSYNKKLLLSGQNDLFDDELNLPKLFAKDAMIKPTYFYKEDSIEKIIKKLKKEDCDVCVIIDLDKNFFGEIDDEDLVRLMAHNALYFPITKVLDRGYTRGSSWRQAKDLALKHKIIVVNKENKVAGVITLSSLLRLLSDY